MGPPDRRRTFTITVTLMFIFTCSVTVEALNQAGYCSFYEECGRNPSVNGSLIKPIIPCVNYSPARRIQGAHYQQLKKVCPMLAKGEGNTTACCSMNQLASLDNSLTLSKAILVRCPACADNFAHLHCITTCSPDQSQTLTITRTINVTILGQKFIDASFKSCKNVRIPATGGYAIATMCGRYGASLCTPQRWLDFQGDTSNGLAPLDIDFRIIPEGDAVPPGIVPYAGTALRCNETTDTGGKACSCQDCVESCPAVAPPPNPPPPFQIGELDGVMVVCLIAFVALSISFLIFLAVQKFVGGHDVDMKAKGEGTKGKDKNSNTVHGAKGRKAEVQAKAETIDPQDVTCTDRNSLATQEFLGSLFRNWGTLMARHPFKVLLVSAAVVAAFAAGLMHIELTTDPVQLWSAPNSRARREKDFHDKHFDPFFRTNQVILTAPGRPSHSYDSLLFGKHTFSGIISKDLILQLLELQKQIQAIEFWSDELNQTATLKDICFAPLNPNNSSLTDCAVNSLPQYFQNSLKNLNAKVNMTELGVTKEVDWRDHFIYCVK
ncbi:hypothetical protein JZ751_004613 [Albula glossodonta]|uniref:Niemann-Pick C1 N-terminal domain-containing protein n=1 Tax=Albula glossodonta TaxID=121402 RepID=A0A8T2N665_9TELE|nr:hypothetical protein JZ751_004613 [Albula glossodonta]